MTDSRPDPICTNSAPVQGLIDALVFAPLGMLRSGERILRTVNHDTRGAIADAKRAHHLAVVAGRSDFDRRITHLPSPLREFFDRLVPDVGDQDAPSEEPDMADQGPAVVEEETPPFLDEVADQPAVDDLAIPGYDILSASQVVSRLEGLSDDQRSAVRAYEQHNRARRTILGKITQLEA